VTEFHPHAHTHDDNFGVHLSDAPVADTLKVRCVLDLTSFDEIVGIEILDLRRQLNGGTVAASPSGGPIRWAYDDEIDALYVHVRDGRGQVQRSVAATARLDSAHRVVRLDVSLARPS
jgi:uncharacterized protein YuzE